MSDSNLMPWQHHPNYRFRLPENYTFETPFRPNYSLAAPFKRLDPDGLMTLVKGYAWDGCSGPVPTTRRTMRGSAAHDACYAFMREGLLPATDFNRKLADDLFYNLILQDGLLAPLAASYYGAVRVFGAKNTKRKVDRKYLEIHYAP